MLKRFLFLYFFFGLGHACARLYTGEHLDLTSSFFFVDALTLIISRNGVVYVDFKGKSKRNRERVDGIISRVSDRTMGIK